MSRLEPDAFHVTEVSQDRSWANYLSNPDYGLRLNQFASGYSSTLEEPRLLVTHHAWNQETKGRYVYVLDREDEDSPWNPGFLPCRTRLDSFHTTHGLGWSSFSGDRAGLSCESRHFLPARGCYEVWRVRVENRGHAVKRVTLAAQAEFLLQSSFVVDVPYYSWYQDVRALGDGSGVEAPSGLPGARSSLGFFRSLVPPDGFEGSMRSFYGSGDATRPESLRAGVPGNSAGAGDASAACLRWDLELAAGEMWETVLFLGEGQSSLQTCTNRFQTFAAVDAEEESVRLSWKALLQSRRGFQFRNPPLDAWLKGFFPYQVHQQALGLVRSGSRGFRDVAQDSVGLSYWNPPAAHQLLLDLARHQHRDGRCLRQWSVTGGADDERDFRDLPFWMIWAVHRYLEGGGDPGILTVSIPYLEPGEGENLFDHMRRGLEYVLRFGPHDLLLIGTGDWNDALSNLGEGGESLWLNQFAYLCLEQYASMLDRWGTAADKNHGLNLGALRDRLYGGVALGWTGSWFLRGYHESGAALGGPDRVFLLPQAWFTISGMAQRDPGRAAAALDAMVARLEHPDGLLKCDPAFDAYDPLVGNLSALTPGVAENFAVYNHASAFGAHALFLAGRTTEALRITSKLLPYRKDAERTKVEPYVLVNYYNGGHYAGHKGRGGISWLTGTANWLALILFEDILPADLSWEPDEA